MSGVLESWVVTVATKEEAMVVVIDFSMVETGAGPGAGPRKH